MGLLVVARLAQRHGIQVRLDSAPAFGTTATVTLPDRLAIPLSMVDQLQPGRWLRDLGAGHHTEYAPAAAAVTSLPPAALTAGPSDAATLAAGQDESLPLTHRPVGPAAGRAVLGQPGPASYLPTPRGPWSLDDDADQTQSLERPEPGEAPTFDQPSASPLTPDPEAVRARLSSLASGIAAAQQGDPAPPPSVPHSR